MAIVERLRSVRARIDAAARAAGRDPADVRLLPVTKFHPAEEVREVLRQGIGLFGENRLQELCAKKAELPEARFAMIGNVQRNKAKLVVDCAAELHSLDSLDLAANLNRRLLDAGRRLPVLIQVNTSGEPQKSGIAPSEAVSFARGLEDYDALDVQGLMTMAVFSDDQEQVAACFRRLGDVQSRLRDEVPDLHWGELSMGMTGDFELAIEHGATIVRIGTAIFGPRPQRAD